MPRMSLFPEKTNWLGATCNSTITFIFITVVPKKEFLSFLCLLNYYAFCKPVTERTTNVSEKLLFTRNEAKVLVFNTFVFTPEKAKIRIFYILLIKQGGSPRHNIPIFPDLYLYVNVVIQGTVSVCV